MIDGRGTICRGRALCALVLGSLLLLVAGCSGGGPGEINPRASADQAMAECDANKDGVLDAKELDACPGLKSGMKRVDKNNDGKLSGDEISERLGFLQQAEAAYGIGLEVTLDGSPLSGATVTLVPEKFMGPNFKKVTAVTDAAGGGILKTEGATDDGIAMGYYRVEVSKKGPGGQESIPAKYNSKTVLGQEICPDVEGRGSSLTVRLALRK